VAFVYNFSVTQYTLVTLAATIFRFTLECLDCVNKKRHFWDRFDEEIQSPCLFSRDSPRYTYRQCVPIRLAILLPARLFLTLFHPLRASRGQRRPSQWSTSWPRCPAGDVPIFCGPLGPSAKSSISALSLTAGAPALSRIERSPSPGALQSIWNWPTRWDRCPQPAGLLKPWSLPTASARKRSACTLGDGRGL